MNQRCVIEKQGGGLSSARERGGGNRGSGQQCIKADQQYIKQVRMKEEQAFDLRDLILSLTDLANPYTSIAIMKLTPRLLHFMASKALSSKTKNIRIIWSEEQAQKQVKMLAQTIKLFPTTKFVIREEFQSENSNLRPLQGQELWTFFKDVTFSQIVVEDIVISPQDLLALILSSFATNKITFKRALPLPVIIQLTSWLHQELRSPSILLDFNSESPSPADLLGFISIWVHSLPLSGLPHKPQEKHFGYPFPLPDRRAHFIGRLQQISLQAQGREFLSVRELQEEGRFLVLTGEHKFQFLCQLLVIVFEENKRISLEVDAMRGDQLIALAEFAVKKFREGYRLIVGHQMELTPCRLVLNTTGLTSIQVQRMMNIAAESGRYELTFYSDILYLEQAINIFLGKPLIKFDFLLPLEQTSPKAQSLLNRIQKHCRKTKLLAYSYSAILNQYAHFGFVFVGSVLQALALQP